jgi:putative transposase
MIDRTHALSIVRQCQILERARSTAYDQATPVSPDELALMCRIDALHLEHPFGGARMLSKMLKRAGHPVGRRRVSTMMKRRGFRAL